MGGLVTSEYPPLPHRTGCMELVSMEDQDARVPALEPFRVEQVVRLGVQRVKVGTRGWGIEWG